MARRLNTRLLFYLLIFIGIPAVIVIVLAAGGGLTTADQHQYVEQAKKYMAAKEWQQAWIAIRSAGKIKGQKDPELPFLMGEIAMHQNPPAVNAALQAYKSAVAQDPQHVEAEQRLAELYTALRFWKEARTEIDRAIEMDPAFGRAYLWSVQVELGAADAEPIQTKRTPFYEAALARCRAGIEKVPDLLELYRLEAMIYGRMGQSDKMAEVLNQAVARNPKNADAYLLKGAWLLSTDKPDEAVETLKQGLAQAGDNARLYIQLGEVAMRKKDVDGAKQYLVKALALDPKNEMGYIRLSSLYRMDNDREKALAAVGQGLAQLPESTTLRIEQADIYLDLGNYKSADDVIAEIAKTAPDAPAMNYLRGKRAILKMQPRQAITYLEQTREAKNLPQARLLLARAYLMTEELGAAQRELEATINDYPSVMTAWRMLAEVQLRLHDPERAFRSARTVLATNPDDTDMRLLVARSLMMRQRMAEALKEAETAADRDKTNPEPLLLMGVICQEMKRTADAEAMYRRAMAIDTKSGRSYQRFIQFLKETNQQDKLAAVLADAQKVLTPDQYLALAGSPEEVERELEARLEKGSATVQDMLSLGRLYQMTDRPDQAKTVFDKAMAKAGTDSNDWRQAWQQLFILDLSTEAYDKAAQLIDQLRQVDPDAVELLFADPLLSLSQEKLDQAADQLRAVTESHKSLSQAYFMLGQVLARQRKWDEAATVLNRALELRPQLLPARILLGRIYYTQGNYTAVLSEVSEALKYDSRLVTALELRAMAQGGLGNWDAAAAAREDIAKLVPDNVNNLIALAALYLQRHMPEKAEETFRRAYALDSDNVLLVRGFADFYTETSRVPMGEKIVDDYVSRHKDGKDASKAYVVRGEFTAKANSPAEAEKYFRKAAELAPKDPSPLIFLGDQYGMAGEWAVAAATYLEAIQRAPDDFLPKRRLADVYMLQGKLAEARTVIDDVLKADPKDKNALVIAGRIASRQDKADEARRFLERALAIDPNFGEAKVRLAELRAGPEPLKALDILSGVETSDPAFEKAMLLRADINSRRVLMREAILDLRRLLDFHPTSVPGRLALASKYMATHEPARAAEIFQQLSREHLEKDPDLLVVLGDAYSTQQKYAEALAYYEKARALRLSSEALVGESRCLVSLNRTNEAIDRINRVMASMTNEVWPRMALAAVYERTGDLPKAFDAIRNGLLRREDWEAGYVYLAEMLARSKQMVEARQVLQVGLAKVPTSISIRAGLATLDVNDQKSDAAVKILEPIAKQFEEIYNRSPEKLDKLRPYMMPIRIYSLTLYNLGRTNEALRYGMMLYSLDPTDMANANNMAWILATSLKDYARANEMIRQCLILLPNHPQILDTAGWIAFLSGKYDEATDNLLASIKYGDNAEAHYHLGRLYQEARDRPDEAKEQYQKALDMGLTVRDKEDAQQRLKQLRGS